MKSNYEVVLEDINLNFKDSKYSTSQLLENTGLDKNTARNAIKNKTSRSISNYIRFCLLYTSPSPRDATLSRMPSSA